MSLYLSFRKWIDRDLSRGPRVSLDADGKTTMKTDGRAGASYFLIAAPLIIDVVLEGFPAGGPSTTGMAIALPFSLLILCFVFWRQVRILKAKSIKSGRYYERKGRYALPAEYRDSEDALLASRRRIPDGASPSPHE
jgi:hypothetical protein